MLRCRPAPTKGIAVDGNAELVAGNEMIEVVRLDDEHTGIEFLSPDASVCARMILHSEDVMFLIGALIERMREHIRAVELCMDCAVASQHGSEAVEGWLGFDEKWQGFVFSHVKDEDGNEVFPHFSEKACDGCGVGESGERFPHFAVRDETDG